MIISICYFKNYCTIHYIFKNWPDYVSVLYLNKQFQISPFCPEQLNVFFFLSEVIKKIKQNKQTKKNSNQLLAAFVFTVGPVVINLHFTTKKNGFPFQHVLT